MMVLSSKSAADNPRTRNGQASGIATDRPSGPAAPAQRTTRYVPARARAAAGAPVGLAKALVPREIEGDRRGRAGPSQIHQDRRGVHRPGKRDLDLGPAAPDDDAGGIRAVQRHIHERRSGRGLGGGLARRQDQAGLVRADPVPRPEREGRRGRRGERGVQVVLKEVLELVDRNAISAEEGHRPTGRRELPEGEPRVVLEDRGAPVEDEAPDRREPLVLREIGGRLEEGHGPGPRPQPLQVFRVLGHARIGQVGAEIEEGLDLRVARPAETYLHAPDEARIDLPDQAGINGNDLGALVEIDPRRVDDLESRAGQEDQDDVIDTHFLLGPIQVLAAEERQAEDVLQLELEGFEEAVELRVPEILPPDGLSGLLQPGQNESPRPRKEDRGVEDIRAAERIIDPRGFRSPAGPAPFRPSPRSWGGRGRSRPARPGPSGGNIPATLRIPAGGRRLSPPRP